ncbi:MAG: OmpH family outer membrane protein [Bacillota bacterium]|jgi:Skp family chaperone for outer membrane proteins
MKHLGVLRVIVIGLVLVTVILLVSGLTGAAGSSGSSVGYVSMEELQKRMPVFVELQKNAEGLFREYNSYTQYIQLEYNNAMKRLEDEKKKAKEGKSAEEQKKIDEKYQDLQKKKHEEIQKKVDEKKNQIQEELTAANETALKKVKQFIAEVAKNQGVSLVLEEKVLFFGGVDLTEKVIIAGGGKAAQDSKK